MSDRQCPSCGGFCSKVGCERQNVCKLPVPLIKNTHESEIYGAGFAAGAASRDGEIAGLRAGALRWDKVKRASSELTLRLHNLRCEYREAAIDAAIAAEGKL